MESTFINAEFKDRERRAYELIPSTLHRIPGLIEAVVASDGPVEDSAPYTVRCVVNRDLRTQARFWSRNRSKSFGVEPSDFNGRKDLEEALVNESYCALYSGEVPTRDPGQPRKVPSYDPQIWPFPSQYLFYIVDLVAGQYRSRGDTYRATVVRADPKNPDGPPIKDRPWLRRSSSFTEDFDPPDPSGDIDGQPAHWARDFRDAIERLELSDTDRVILALHYFESPPLELKTVAAKIGISAHAAYKRHQRLLERLRRDLLPPG